MKSSFYRIYMYIWNEQSTEVIHPLLCISWGECMYINWGIDNATYIYIYINIDNIYLFDL